jgi:hypothetical protein
MPVCVWVGVFDLFVGVFVSERDKGIVDRHVGSRFARPPTHPHKQTNILPHTHTHTQTHTHTHTRTHADHTHKVHTASLDLLVLGLVTRQVCGGARGGEGAGEREDHHALALEKVLGRHVLPREGVVAADLCVFL